MNNTTTAITFDIWVEQIKKKYLKIKDIMSLKKGDKIVLVNFDRNFYDRLPNPNPITIYEPMNLFKDVICTYTHEKDLCGKMGWDFGERSFEFELHLIIGQDRFWFPMNKGNLDIEDFRKFIDDYIFNWKINQNEAKILKEFPLTENYKVYPEDTLVGFRGPMFLLSECEKMPKIIFDKYIKLI